MMTLITDVLGEKFKANKFPRRTKTQTTLQMENAECGAACLVMLLGFYKKHLKLSVVRKDCGVSRDGVKALNIIKAAKAHGLIGKGYNKSCEDLYKLRRPSILFWEFNHFVVLEGFNQKGAWINDPAIGHRFVTHEDFSNAYTGVVLEFKQGKDFQPEGARHTILPGLINRCREHRSVLAYLTVVSTLNVLPILILAAAASVFTDRILSGTSQLLLDPLLTVVAVAASGLVLLTVIYHYFLRRLQIGLTISLGSKFIYHLLHLPIEYFEQRGTGEIVSREALNDSVASVVSEGVIQFVNDLVNMLIFCVVMFLISAKLTLIAMAFTVPLFVYMRWSAATRTEASMGVAMELSKASGIAIEGVSSIEAYKASGQERSFFERWASAFARATDKQQRLALLNLLPTTIIDILSQSLTVSILLVGALEIMNGALSLGDLIAFQILVGGFIGPLGSLSGFYAEFQELHGEIERLDDVLEHPKDVRFSTKSLSNVNNTLQLTGKLQLVNVGFRFSPLEPLFINNLNLAIAPGQRVAVVGASGSGKSTLARIASGASQAEQGAVLLDDKNLIDWPSEILSSALAVVSQETFLIEGSLRDNLTLWDTSCTDEKVIDACRDAEIWATIDALPNGLSTLVHEGGANFSGGERQRLEIARALLHEPRLLILDEATSALDPETEKRINQNILLRGCTCLIVAHRLSSIRDCDKIFVLSEGALVESGTHAELWQANGQYRLLYNADELAQQ